MGRSSHHSKSKAGRRDGSHSALITRKPLQPVACPNCKAPKFAHSICASCGYKAVRVRSGQTAPVQPKAQTQEKKEAGTREPEQEVPDIESESEPETDAQSASEGEEVAAADPETSEAQPEEAQR